MKFSNILLVLDARRPGDVLALLRAAEFARTEGATLTVYEIINWSMPHAPRFVTDGTVRVLTDAIRANKIQRLKDLVAKGGSNLDISVELLIGKPHIEVARMVREKQYDFVIKPLAGRRADCCRDRGPYRYFRCLASEHGRDIVAPLRLLAISRQATRTSIAASGEIRTHSTGRLGQDPGR